MNLNKREYQLKQIEKQQELISKWPNKATTEIDRAIWHLEMAMTEIEPYSPSWRMGRVKALKYAVKTLKDIKDK